MSLSLQNIIDEGIFDEIIRVFNDPINAKALLGSINYPTSMVPEFQEGDEPKKFWLAVCKQLEKTETVEGGLNTLVKAAAYRYLNNTPFAKYLHHESSDFSQPSISIILNEWDEPQKLIDHSRALALKYGLPSDTIQLGFANIEGILLTLSNWTTEQALKLATDLKSEAHSNGETVHTTVSTSEFRDYLISRLFVEGPDQARFQINNARASTKVGDIAQGVLSTQYDHGKFGSGTGAGRRATVDHVKEDGSTERCDPDKTLHDSNIRDGDTIQVAPEATAGCFLEGTRISLADGFTKPIQEINIGDVLISGLPNSKRRTLSRVVEIFRGNSQGYYTLNGTLQVTGYHPIWANGTWVIASKLRIGDILQDRNGNNVELKSIKHHDAFVGVYNLQVSSKEHTFIAENILVHNKELYNLQMGSIEPWSKSFNKLVSIPSYSKILRINVPLPSLASSKEFFEGVIERIKAIDNIYSVFALLTSTSEDVVNAFITHLKKRSDSLIISFGHFHRFLIAANVEPLRIISIRYGSPASFDFLGIGKVVEMIREIIKDLTWRGKHEKKIAMLELKNRQAEIEKAKVEIEKSIVEIAKEKLEIFERINNLKISDDDQKKIVSTLLPEMLIVVKNPVTLLPKDEIKELQL